MHKTDTISVRRLTSIVAKNLKRLRQDRGLTQEDVADLCGMEYKQYQRYEGSSQEDMHLSTIEKIAKGLDINPLDLFEK
ncbi:helix-turn-helix domain-containing protein [Patescibacteria group bacterium]|nr:helix-turn-helix domain-containing protein [Patescibacteria group bacterium]